MIKIYDVEGIEKKVECTLFPDGTKKFEQTPTEEAEITWNYESDDELVTLIMLTKHLRNTGCKYIRLFMPYIPNARFDRVTDKKEVFTLKYFAETINWIGFDEVYVIDPHSYVSESLFDRLTVINPKDIVMNVINKTFLEEMSLNKFSLYFPDAGACKRYSGMFKIPHTYGLKQRDWETGSITGLDVVGDENLIKGKTILIIDDICSKGGTFYHSAKKLKELGVDKIYLYVTHCENTILKGELLNSGLVEKVFTTNSIFTEKHEKIEVYDLN